MLRMYRDRISSLPALLLATSLPTLFAMQAMALAEVDDVMKMTFRIEEEVDLGSPKFNQAARLLAEGDTLGCRREIIAYFARRGPKGWLLTYGMADDPVALADKLLADTISIGTAGSVSIADSLDWFYLRMTHSFNYNLICLEFLTYLNRAYKITGDTSYLRKGMELIRRFVEVNCSPSPHKNRYAWIDHSIAKRVMFLTDFWQSWQASDIEDEQAVADMLELLWRHSLLLKIKRFFSPVSNHGFFNVIALLRLSIALPEMKDASEWSSLAIERLKEVTKRDFYPSGLNREHSPGYHINVTTKLLEIEEEFKRNRIPMPRFLRRALDRAVYYSLWLFHPDGTLSLMGDSEREQADWYRDAMGGRNVFTRYVFSRGKEGLAPRAISEAIRDAGVFIMRSGWGKGRRFEDESYVIADFGEAYPIHNQDDFMNFEFYSKGFRWITDSGRGEYIGCRQRQYLVSAEAHNVILPMAGKSVPKWADRVPKLKTRTMSKKQVNALMEQAENEIAPQAKIRTFQVLLPYLEGKNLDKARISMGVCYLEGMNDTTSFLGCIGEVISHGATDEYGEVCWQILNTVFGDSSKAAAALAEVERKSANKGKVTRRQSRRFPRRSERGRRGIYPAYHSRGNPKVINWISCRQYDYIEGVMNFSVMNHSRALMLIRPSVLLVVDQVKTMRAIELRELFHLEAGVEVSGSGERLILEAPDGSKCLVFDLMAMTRANGPDATRIFSLGSGWYSPSFNKVLPAPVLTYTLRINPKQKRKSIYFAYLFVPCGEDDPSEYNVRLECPRGWNPAGTAPLRFVIVEPGHETEVSYLPSAAFVRRRGSGSSRAKPWVQVMRRRR